MKRLAWATDIHLNFIDERKIREFCDSLKSHDPDAVLLGGDIGEAPSVEGYLHLLESMLQLPIFFVLGNHDYYRGSIREVSSRTISLAEGSEFLHFLTGEEVFEMIGETALVGDGLWGDGRLGDFFGSQVMLSDYFWIEELTDIDQETRYRRLNDLGDQAAHRLRTGLEKAIERYRKVIVLTHVSPFRESCWYDGKISDDDWLPHFSCKAAGEFLAEVMEANPDKEMLVLCGHTHGEGISQILPNLLVKMGSAKYGHPRLNELIVIE